MLLRRFLCSVLLLVTIIPAAPLAHAGTFVVTRFDDPPPDACNSGDCSLREAVIAANSSTGANTINLPAGIYRLAIPGQLENEAATGDLDIYSSLTIAGAGPSRTIIDGGGFDRVFDVLEGSVVTFTGVTIQNGNTSGRFNENGGGISNQGGDITLKQVAVIGNTSPVVEMGTAGGGIYNSYGGFHEDGIKKGKLTIVDSLISNNSSQNGGGIWNAISDLIIVNSTISGNGADLGGGILNARTEGQLSSVTLNNVTITENTAQIEGGDILDMDSTVSIKNSIVAKNNGVNCLARGTSQGNNLSSDANCGFTAPGDIVTSDPKLGPLADNGGPTKTHALLTGSPAIDAGSNNSCPATDQRGVVRPQGSACDIGAYEANASIVSGADVSVTVSASPSPAQVGKDLTYTITAKNNGPSAATAVTLTDVLTGEFNFVSVTPSQGNCNGTSNISCSLGSLANGASATVTVVVKPQSPQAIVSTGSVQGAEPDSTTTNNTNTTTTEVQAGNSLVTSSYVVLLGGINSHQFSKDDGPELTTDFRNIQNALGRRVIYFSYGALIRYASGGKYCQGWQGNNCTSSDDLRSLYLLPSYASQDTRVSILGQTAALQWLLGQIVKNDPAAQIDLVGYSLGGIVAARWAADFGTSITPGPSQNVRKIVLIESPVGGIPTANACGVDPHALCLIFDSLFGRAVLEQLQLPIDPRSANLSIIPSLKGAATRYPVLAIESTADYFVNGESLPVGQGFGATIIGRGTQSWPSIGLTRRAARQLGELGKVDPVSPIDLVALRGVIDPRHRQPLSHPCTVAWVAEAVRGASLPASCE